VDAYLRIGELLRRRGQAQKAMAIHMDLAQRAGLSAEDAAAVRKALAQDQLSMGQPHEARRLLLELCKHSSTEAWALSRVHRLLLEEGKFEEAYKRRQEMARMGEPLEPRTAAVYLTLAGRAASDAGEHRRGRVLVRDALKLDSQSAAAQFTLGEIYERDGRPEDAVRPGRSSWSMLRSCRGWCSPISRRCFSTWASIPEIAGIYQQVLRRSPENTDALFGLARFSEKKGDHQTALSHLSRNARDRSRPSCSAAAPGADLQRAGESRAGLAGGAGVLHVAARAEAGIRVHTLPREIKDAALVLPCLLPVSHVRSPAPGQACAHPRRARVTRPVSWRVATAAWISVILLGTTGAGPRPTGNPRSFRRAVDEGQRDRLRQVVPGSTPLELALAEPDRNLAGGCSRPAGRGGRPGLSPLYPVRAGPWGDSRKALRTASRCAQSPDAGEAGFEATMAADAE